MKNETSIRTRVISCFVFREHNGKTETLLMKRVGEPLNDEWCQVAGRLEEGETSAEAALRELEEETGLVPRHFYAAGLCEQFYSHEVDAIILIPVFVACVDNADEVTLNEEHSDYIWLDLVRASERLPFATQRRVLQDVWQDFVTSSPSPLLHIELPLSRKQ